MMREGELPTKASMFVKVLWLETEAEDFGESSKICCFDSMSGDRPV